MKTISHKITVSMIDKDLMEWGYLCPDLKLHQYGELSEWVGDKKYTTCKNCGKTIVALMMVPAYQEIED